MLQLRHRLQELNQKKKIKGKTEGAAKAPALDPQKRRPIRAFILLAVGTIIGWMTDDWVKPPVMDFINSQIQEHLPWDNSLVQYFMGNPITFAATNISGCSNGGLKLLLDNAKKQGLTFPYENVVANARLCQSWGYHGSARSILEAMAIRFDKCFSLDQANSFQLRLNSGFICKTNFALNDKTNDWERTPGFATYLCLSHAVDTPMSKSEPPAHECPPPELKKLQFVR